MNFLKGISKPFLAIMLALMLIVSLAPSALAAPTIQDEEVDLKGVVTAVDADTFTMEVDEDGTLASYTVQPPVGFDLSSLEIGDEVEVEGELEDELVLADKVEVEEPDDEDDDLEDEEEQDEEGEDGENFFCANSDESHPFAATLAERYETEYEEVMGYFCEGSFGFGQIMLALQTAKLTEGEASAFLDRRAGGEGWGQIWKDLELIGKPEHAGPPEWAGPPEGHGRPDEAGPPEGKGRPEEAGPPEGQGRPDWAGPPEDRGRPEGAGPPSR